MSGWQQVAIRILQPLGRQTLRELLITMCAGDEEVLSRVRLRHVVLRTEKYVTSLPFLYFFLFKVTLWLLQYALPPLALKLRPFTWMSLPERLRYLESWQSSPIYAKRTLFKMLQCVCISHLYSERDLLIHVGYEPSMLHREGMRQGTNK